MMAYHRPPFGVVPPTCERNDAVDGRESPYGVEEQFGGQE
jgi:hypothetical protein